MKRALTGLLAVIAAGCSSFERDWKRARESPPAAGSIQGPWEGTWRSEVSGHSGRLRSIIAPAEGGGYSARYKASWGPCFSYSYTLPMAAEESAEGLRFKGQADLGWLAGGVFHYEASAAGGRFTSLYRSAKDHGVFELERPGAP